MWHLRCVPCRCIRQTIDKLAKEQKWKEKHNIWWVGGRELGAVLGRT